MIDRKQSYIIFLLLFLYLMNGIDYSETVYALENTDLKEANIATLESFNHGVLWIYKLVMPAIIVFIISFFTLKENWLTMKTYYILVIILSICNGFYVANVVNNLNLLLAYS